MDLRMRKAKARRLKDRRCKKLQVLRKGGFLPDVIARLAAQLAGQLQSAAGEFVQAVVATASNPADTQTAIAVGDRSYGNGGRSDGVAEDKCATTVQPA